jgi:hypothetical protein
LTPHRPAFTFAATAASISGLTGIRLLVSYPQLRNELNCSNAKEQGDRIPGVPLRPQSL